MNYKNFKHVWYVLLCLSAFTSSSARCDFRSGVNAFKGWPGKIIGLTAVGVVIVRQIMKLEVSCQNRLYRKVEDALARGCEEEGDSGANKDEGSSFENILLIYLHDRSVWYLREAYGDVKKSLVCEDPQRCVFPEEDDKKENVDHSTKTHSARCLLTCRLKDDLEKTTRLFSKILHWKRVAPHAESGDQGMFLRQVRDNREDGNARRDKTIQFLMEARRREQYAIVSCYGMAGEPNSNYENNYKQWRTLEEQYGNAKAVSYDDFDKYREAKVSSDDDRHQILIQGNKERRRRMSLDREMYGTFRKYADLDKYSQGDEAVPETREGWHCHNYGNNNNTPNAINDLKEKLRASMMSSQVGRILDDEDKVMTPKALKAWQDRKNKEAAAAVGASKSYLTVCKNITSWIIRTGSSIGSSILF